MEQSNNSHPVPPKQETIASRLVALGVSLVGDTGQVAKEMLCTEEELRNFAAGTTEPTWVELDRLVALIVREQGKLISHNRKLLAKIKPKTDR